MHLQSTLAFLLTLAVATPALAQCRGAMTKTEIKCLSETIDGKCDESRLTSSTIAARGLEIPSESAPYPTTRAEVPASSSCGARWHFRTSAGAVLRTYFDSDTQCTN
ncbi:uncharacterized protein VDAG_00845 [Verticillium dahliae VdLs.17]|uniref:Uncharacterized protein n=1 Tax=Verticillium dahliae (strain VdLs.17 / ATCC MYA-4575 / FGSC 10137) TaxID=498257 RepID=G2WSR4_VERDV|nr:uncharacterized protein VDAG_00845 [Verticillium dahliae VdLs.17]EGY17163.1 hypothetical protein VDAG_00845 [Verticillium dahliae VdLs.17]KAH6701747.1 hypothetical protein EV126DRAFT_383882 [Verticillium dahliae]